MIRPFRLGNPAAMGSAANLSAIVSGAGTAAANGAYTPRGTFNGKPYYNLVGQPDNPASLAISWDGSFWTIWDAGASPFYQSDEVDPALVPWDVSPWNVTGGNPPAPTVTHS